MEQSRQPRILVVDDDSGIRELLGDYLKKQEMEVEVVRDGREMDSCLAGFEPDLVVMDLMLPGDDGLALTRRLKAERDLPVIMLSARGEDIDRSTFLPPSIWATGAGNQPRTQKATW